MPDLDSHAWLDWSLASPKSSWSGVPIPRQLLTCRHFSRHGLSLFFAAGCYGNEYQTTTSRITKEKMMNCSRRVRSGAGMVSTLGVFAIAFGLCSTETASAQEPAWHAPFDQATAAARAWNSTPRFNSPMGGYLNRMSQGASVWRQNQESLRQSMLTPRYGNYRTYATPAPRRGTAVTRPTRSWTSSSRGLFRGRFARRWR